MEFISFLEDSALNELDKANKKLLEMASNVDNVSKKMKNISTPSGADNAIKSLTDDYVKQQKAITDLQIKLERYTQSQNRTKISNNALEKSEISLANARERQQKAIDRENAKLEASASIYGKVQTKLNDLQKEYRDLATKKELGLTLSKKEEDAYNRLQSRIQKYDTTLKAVDASMGKHQRNVGNYASAFNPLSNSISQLGREMPAFANSVQTGFMAISNNLPIFFDAMQQVIAQNKELQAQGKPTKSILTQLAGALFSFQTLLSVGVTLLTLYGKEIVAWASALWGASEALDELNENQKKFNKTRIEGQKASVSERTELEKYIRTMRNSNIPLEERMIALKQLRSQFPFYFKDLKDEALLNGDISKQLRLLNSDLEKKSILEKATELNVANKQRLIDLKEEKKLLAQSIPDLEKRVEIDKELALLNPREMSGVLAASENALNKARKRTVQVSKEILEFEKAIAENTGIINKYKTDTIRLEYQEDEANKRGNKTKKERIDLNFREIESEYNLRKSILERQKAERNDRASNEQLQLDDRLKARKEFSEKSIEILELEVQKEKAILTFKQTEDLNKNNTAYKNKEISHQQFLENIKDINKRYNNEIATVDMDYSLKWNDLMNSDAEFYKKIQDQKRKYTEDTNKLILDSEKAKFEKISKDEKNTLLARNLAHQKYISIAKEQLQADKIREMSNATSQEQLDNIIKKYELLAKALEELETPYQKARKEFEKYLETISNGAIDKALGNIGMNSLQMFLDIDKNGQSTFMKLWETAETTKEKFALSFQAIGDVFQETMQFMDMANKARFENEMNRLNMQKDIAIQFAGESATAKEEIERQYEERRRKLERQRAEQEKRMAIFNIVTDTAQAIIATYARVGFPAGIPLAIAMGAIGAAQIAMVASQEIPAFAVGTDDAPQGWAWTQEKGAEIITDKNGKVKSLGSNKGAQLTYLNKGDKVFNATESALMFNSGLNSILAKNGINEVSNNNQVIAPIVNVATKDNYHFEVNEQGFKTFIKRGNAKSEVLNARVRMQKRNV